MIKEVLIEKKCDLQKRMGEYIAEINRLEKAVEEVDNLGLREEDRLEMRQYLLGIKDKDLACLNIADRRLTQVNGFLEKLG